MPTRILKNIDKIIGLLKNENQINDYQLLINQTKKFVSLNSNSEPITSDKSKPFSSTKKIDHTNTNTSIKTDLQQDFNESEYKRKYYDFWQMSNARIGFESDFTTVYFEALKNYQQRNLTLLELTHELYLTPSVGDKKRIQFSFTTKLIHMHNQNFPIYDSRIVSFYKIKSKYHKDINERISSYIEQHNTISKKHSELLEDPSIIKSIDKFNESFPDNNFTKIKIIDSLIWSYEGLPKE